MIRQVLPWYKEIIGLLLFVLAIVTFLSLLGLTQSSFLDPWTRFVRQLSGWGAFPISLIIAGAGLLIALRRIERPRMGHGQLIGLELILIAGLALSHMILGAGLSGALKGEGGGLIGWALSDPLVEFLGPFLTLLFILLLVVLGLALLVRIAWDDVIYWLSRASLNLRNWSIELDDDIAEREAYLASLKHPEPSAIPEPAITPEPQIRIIDELIIIDDSASGAGPKVQRRSVRLPPMEVLEQGSTLALTTEEIDEKKQIIERTLLDFGLPATVTEIRRGPAVTQFGVQPGYIEKPGPDGQPKQFKVRVGQIAGLQKDLALALAVTRLRVQAPVPGRGIVGIEVPNSETQIVRLRPIVESEAFYSLQSPLSVAMGRDVTGSPVVTDLGKLPHLLIAGTTGSGKSVCLNALITCLVFNNTPDQLKLVMIDPKKVELIRFNGMPHLLGKVEVEGERVIGVLRWLTAEMDRRYELFAAVGAKHLNDYNRKIARRRDAKRIPNIAVFIDELADLMASFPGDVERTLCRLAQMARATGIHLVVATQRPSTDVITGLIKANFPARASFSVASGMDSRVILDSQGAEHLLGKGDMLFLPPDVSSPQRIQGCFVSDSEIEAIVEHWQKQGPAIEADLVPEDAQDEVPWEKMIVRKAFISERDEMLEDAIALAQKHDKISASLIQRRLRVGYPRAARLMEGLYELGLVEDPKEGGRTRRTLIDGGDDPLDDFLFQDD